MLLLFFVVVMVAGCCLIHGPLFGAGAEAYSGLAGSSGWHTSHQNVTRLRSLPSLTILTRPFLQDKQRIWLYTFLGGALPVESHPEA